MTTPKAFQLATVAAACKVLRSKTGKPRFLVADEVGLGKTVVAQQVIADLARYRRRPLVVYYVSSSLTIAAQNGSKLVEALSDDDEEVKSALCVADRLSMLPFVPGPTHPRVHLYTLTPDTSLPNRQGRRRDGRKDERALITVLVEQCWPGLDPDFFEIFPRQATRHWESARANAESRLSRLMWNRDSGLTSLRQSFKDKVRIHLKLSEGQHVPPILLERAYQDPLGLIAALRTALIECTFGLKGFQPDLVIFDEFQRFRDLVEPTMGLNGEQRKEPDSVLAQLRGDARRVPLLLLSATPYSLYNHRDEEALFGSHHDQLLELLCFLFGDGKHGLRQAKLAQEYFMNFGRQLRGGGEALDYVAIESTSRKIEQHLTRVMSRTERSLALEQSAPENEEQSPKPIEVMTQPADWLVFRHLSERFPERYRSSAVTYWRSVPLPMQTMGASYVAWDKANKSGQRSSVKPFALTKAHLERHQKVHWPHGKLRALVDGIGADTLCLPWLPPSLPWWSLRGAWRRSEAQQGKVLLFSRFRATPKAVAAALSHETRVRATQIGNMPSSEQRTLTLSAKRMPVFALFYPSLWLAECTDPLACAGQSPGKVKKAITEQLGRHLKTRQINVTQDKRIRREFWRLVASLDSLFDSAGSARTSVDLEQSEVRQLWEQAADEPVDSISGGELNLMAEYALSAPGVVLARSLLRHLNGEPSAESRALLVKFCLGDWRNYFDNPVFVASLRKRKRQYPDALRQAVIDGNLEATLDEQLWFMVPSGVKDFATVLPELAAALGIRGGRVTFHRPDNEQVSVRCQCDVAMPLAQELEASAGEGEARPPRANQIRKAFNSPFWPFVLTTTSVGQEGLDFHPWCRTLVHWDLPGNPVDLEQREGRIQRYAGLAVRRSMADDHGSGVLAALGEGESPWRELAKVVDSQPSQGTAGLEPWWHYRDAKVKSLFFHLPASEEARQLELLKQQRTVYRLALGQQHQEDFVRMISNRDPEILKSLASLIPNLSAWKQQKKN